MKSIINYPPALLSFACYVLLSWAAMGGICGAPVQAALPPLIRPEDPSVIKIGGLQNTVTVQRDGRYIPYVEAKTRHDLYFAQGYVTASDRLWQMDLYRRMMRGEMAEIFGRDELKDDQLHRTYGFAEVVDDEINGATPEARAVLEAYAAGVNAYIASLDEKSLPVEFRILQYRPQPWKPADSLLIIKLFAESLSTTWMLDIQRAALAAVPAETRNAILVERSPLDVLVVGKDNPRRSGTPAGKDSTFKSFANPADAYATLGRLEEVRQWMSERVNRLGFGSEGGLASNNWVVSGKHTASGKPLLANDPHLSPSAPSIWYMAELQAPGLHVAGVTAPGLPGIVIGHNERIAWGFTNVGPDVQDLYLETFDKDNPRRYLTPEGWRDAKIRREEIKVRKSFTGTGTDIVSLEVTVTRHGPIIFEKDSKRYALKWTALDPKLNDAEGFEALNKARDWDEFRAALARYAGPMQNMVYADASGHIGYYAAGRVPIRKSGDGSVPYDGSKDEGEWTGFIPFDALPHLFDPLSGIIVTANQRIAGDSYPYFLTRTWPAPYRARRIYNLLQGKNGLTAEAIRGIQKDTYSISGVTFAREVVRTGRANPASSNDGKWSETIKLFDTWDGRFTSDSRAAVLVSAMRNAFRDYILTAAIGTELGRLYWPGADTFIDNVITGQPASRLPSQFKNYSDLLHACETEARATIEKKLGKDDTQWTWGRNVQVRFPHPLAAVPVIGRQFDIPAIPQNGSGGSVATVNVGRAVSMRFIADPDDWNKTEMGITLGESGNPASPYWTDQLADWRAVTPGDFPFSKAAIAKASRAVLLLRPL